MSDILIIGFWIAMFIGLSAMLDTIFFIITLIKMGENRGLRKSFFFLLICSIVTIICVISGAYFGITYYSITNNLWSIIPIGTFIVALLGMKVSSTLIKSLVKIQEK